MFDVLYTVLNNISNLVYYIFGLPLIDKKRYEEIKKVTFFRVTLDYFLKFINSPGEKRVDIS